MASAQKNLSSHSRRNIFDISKTKFGIVISEWNDDVTDSLYSGCMQTLLDKGAKRGNIITHYVPGSFELPLGAKWLATEKKIDAVICLGAVIQGETRHFDFICSAVAQGIMNVGLEFSKPVVFGVLTTNTKKQALDRAGGKLGNKGDEAAITAIKMLGF
ncbi:MAG TPA: 6,7-dimethyl-8-ribityllumazine synthase [Cyclobacteriaceae bacterium]|jgi:6,7-dimethyl-8-ribityllumazine synthase